jgi:hypothetical protein
VLTVGDEFVTGLCRADRASASIGRVSIERIISSA